MNVFETDRQAKTAAAAADCNAKLEALDEYLERELKALCRNGSLKELGADVSKDRREVLKGRNLLLEMNGTCYEIRPTRAQRVQASMNRFARAAKQAMVRACGAQRPSIDLKKEARDPADMLNAKTMRHTYGAWAVQGGVRTATWTAAAGATTEVVKHGAEIGGYAANLIGLPAVGVHIASSTKALVDLLGDRTTTLLTLKRLQAPAMRYHAWKVWQSSDQPESAPPPPQPEPGDRKAFMRYIQTMQKLPRFSETAARTAWATQAAAVRDVGLQTPASIVQTVYSGIRISELSSGAAMTTLSAAAPALALTSVLSIAIGVVDLYQSKQEIVLEGGKKNQSKLRRADANRTINRLQKKFSELQARQAHLSPIELRREMDQALQEELTQEELKVVGALASNKFLTQVIEVFASNQDRLHRQATRNRYFGVFKMIKGALNIGTYGALTGVTIATLAGAAGAAGGGVPLAIVAGVVIGIYMLTASAKNIYKYKADHAAKKRQRAARVLRARHPMSELAKMHANRETVRIRLSKGVLDLDSHRFAKQQTVEVDLASNEFVAIELMADSLRRYAQLPNVDSLDAFDADQMTVFDTGTMLVELFKSLGMSPLAIQAMLEDSLEQPHPDRAIEGIASYLAPSFGMVYRVGKDGAAERPHPGVYLGMFNKATSGFDSSMMGSLRDAAASAAAAEDPAKRLDRTHPFWAIAKSIQKRNDVDWTEFAQGILDLEASALHREVPGTFDAAVQFAKWIQGELQGAPSRPSASSPSARQPATKVAGVEETGKGPRPKAKAASSRAPASAAVPPRRRRARDRVADLTDNFTKPLPVPEARRGH
ncbi:MAG: hypothetical protein EOO22_04925 [Comamonadaceae bacterium]|nr:MAG: hypothetical protein EOO22_04925 [Comamonadaceae bacterium]